MTNDRTMIRDEFSEDGPLPPGLELKLTFIAGPLQGKSFQVVSRKTTIGRSSGEIVLNDSAVSKEHALILFDGGHFLVRDLESTNGTYLNGGQVWESFLNKNDEITVGNSVIKVDIRQTASSASWADLGMDNEPAADADITNAQAEREGKDPLLQALFPDVKAAIQVVEGVDAGKSLIFKTRGIVIGRGKADLELNDMDVSRKHASIEFMTPERVILKDLRSMNGTFVNGRWTTVGNLANADVIKIGKTTLHFYVKYT
jgi:pSer/pThr/pTyr-binding forkhead associated (FHA) protein